MTSKERVRAALEHKITDRVPAAFEAVDTVTQKLMEHYGYTDYSQLLERYEVDIVPVSPRYIGPKLKEYVNEKGETVKGSYWGFEELLVHTDIDTYTSTIFYPLEDVETIEEVEQYQFPDPDWFDYSVVTEQCERYKDKATIVGHEGPFQIVTWLMKMETFCIRMIEEPEVVKRILDKMVEFELEYYRRIFEAGKGNIDILRVHDDYGTQISLLFSMDMWRKFFKENTKKLVDLAHQYGVFYQQHSCGAVRDIIPDLISCGVDSLEPLQKVNGLEPESLHAEFGGKIAFHGGIDTQNLLPNGSVEAVRRECERFVDALGQNGGYILMASQAFEGDVPIENIEAVYQARRVPQKNNI